MNGLRVYINGKPVVLKSDSGVFLNFEANSLENLSQRSGTLSEEFELEDCPQNRAALGNSQLVTSIDNTPYELLPTRLEVNGNFFMAGSSSISEFEESFPASFASDNADFFQRIKGKALSELDLSDLDHAYTVDNVQDFNPHDPDRGFFYPVVNYGRWDSRFYDGSNQEFWELYPAVYVRTLLERMAAPYTITGALLSEPRFNRLAVAFTNETFRYRESYLGGFVSSARPATDTDLSNPAGNFILFTEIISDAAGQIIAPGIFEAQQAGYYSFRVELGFNIFAAFTGTAWLNKPGSVEPVIIAEAGVSEGVDQVVILEGTTFMYAGDTVVVGVDSANTTTGIAFVKDDSVFKGELQARVVDGGPVHLEANLPDVKQDELLATVVNMFDVILQTNDLTKTISFDFRRDISPATALNWSDKVDYSRRVRTVFRPEFYGQENIFAYAENEEKDTSGRPIVDSMSIPLGNANSEPEKEVFTSVFTHTLNKPAFRNARVLPYIPLWKQQVKSFGIWRDGVDYDAEDYVYYPDENGILYWMATQVPDGIPGPGGGGPPTYWIPAEEDGVFQVEGATPRLLIAEELPAGQEVAVGKYIYGGPVNHTKLYWTAKFATNDPDLSIEYDALRQEYYGMLERILAKPKFITPFMRLTPADVTGLDFTKPILLNHPERNLQGLFYLRKVSQYNPAERSSVAVELALIGFIPVDIEGGANREHSNEFSNEYA